MLDRDTSRAGQCWYLRIKLSLIDAALRSLNIRIEVTKSLIWNNELTKDISVSSCAAAIPLPGFTECYIAAIASLNIIELSKRAGQGSEGTAITVVNQRSSAIDGCETSALVYGHILN